jgi:hypothetical protein
MLATVTGGPPHGDRRVDPNLKIRPYDKGNVGLVCRKKKGGKPLEATRKSLMSDA